MKLRQGLIFFICCLPFLASSQGISINAENTPPDPSAMLDIQSVSKGFLIPRMTEAERDVIVLPATGLTIYQTDGAAGFYYFNGVLWTPITSGGGGTHWVLNGSDIYNTNVGNVGIKTTTPLAPLHIMANSEAFRLQGLNPYIAFYDSTGTYKGFLWQGPGQNVSMGTAQGSSGRLEFYNDLNLNMKISKWGAVEIAGTDPGMSLSKSLVTYGESYINSGNDLEIAGYRPMTLIATPGDLILQRTVTSMFGSFYAGKVGIGTDVPACKTHIRSANEILRLEGIGYQYLTFYTGDLYKGFLLSDGDNIGLGTSAENTTGSVWFYAGGSIKMMMLPNGNIGIGTLNPTQKLAVNGTVRAKELIVETGWADYVFDDNYDLPGLEEIEKFIHANKRLPDMPSAREVEENGLAVGETQRLMMEKIEELTLYVIQLHKEIELLKTINK